MRGNEVHLLLHDEAGIAFPIPMRGNELIILDEAGVDVHLVPNPYEG